MRLGKAPLPLLLRARLEKIGAEHGGRFVGLVDGTMHFAIAEFDAAKRRTIIDNIIDAVNDETASGRLHGINRSNGFVFMGEDRNEVTEVNQQGYFDLYWHVHIGTPDHSDYYVNDLSFQDLLKKVVIPFRSRKPFNLGGLIIREDQKNVKHVQIVQTKNDLRTILKLKAYATRDSLVIVGVDDGFYAFSEYAQGIDYTNELLFAEDQSNASVYGSVTKPLEPSAQDIFIIHGHNVGMKESTARLISTLGLKPTILHEEPNGGRTLIEKFLESASAAGFAIVLSSADDEVTGGSFQARPNVMFELGFFVGRLGRGRVVILKEPKSTLPTDLSGVAYINYGESDWKYKVADELSFARYVIDKNKIS